MALVFFVPCGIIQGIIPYRVTWRSNFKHSDRAQCHHRVCCSICACRKANRKHDFQNLWIHGDVPRLEFHAGSQTWSLHARPADYDVLRSSSSDNLGRLSKRRRPLLYHIFCYSAKRRGIQFYQRNLYIWSSTKFLLSCSYNFLHCLRCLGGNWAPTL